MSKLVQNVLSHSFVRFGIVGGINTLIDFLLFFSLISFFDWPLVPANVTSFSVAVVNSYLLNKTWSFRESSRTFSWSQFVMFLIVSILAVTLNTAILLIGQPYLALIYLKIIGAIAAPLFNYVCYRYVVFRSIN